MYPAPRLVYWEVTKRCNLRCAHCRAVPEECASFSELSLADGFRLIDSIAEVGHPILILTGGEPLLRRDIFDLAAYGHWRGLPMALATNGTLVTRDMARRILAAGCRRVSISLDGPEAETHDQFRRVSGAFDQAVDGFIHLKELGMSMQVNTTVTVHNQDRLEEMLELVRKLGADAWHVFLLVPVGCGLEIASQAQLTPRGYEEILFWMDELAQREIMEVRATCAPHIQRIRLQRQAIPGAEVQDVRRSMLEAPGGADLEQRTSNLEPRISHRCLAGTGICFVSHHGDVFPCGYLPIPAGNVRERPFGSIWDTGAIFADLRNPDRLGGKCGTCEYRVICGGCRARAFGQTGHYLHEEPFCNYLPARPA
jgi:radical SAM protein with 4Fe4S-binding SPASM domain